jgi:8-oxo-dGTP diphosphatase
MGQLWRYARTLLGLILRRPIVGTSIIPILPDGRIALVRRRDNGQWGLPGGIVDWGEDVTAAAHRELLEETGLQLVQIDRLVGVYSHPDRDPRFHSICVVLAAEAQGAMKVYDSDEIVEVQAFTVSDIPKEHLAHDHQQQLQDYLNGATVLA